MIGPACPVIRQDERRPPGRGESPGTPDKGRRGQALSANRAEYAVLENGADGERHAERPHRPARCTAVAAEIAPDAAGGTAGCSSITSPRR
jgi:hypothetical protein